jgi:hypothetical protein
LFLHGASPVLLVLDCKTDAERERERERERESKRKERGTEYEKFVNG